MQRICYANFATIEEHSKLVAKISILADNEETGEAKADAKKTR